MGRPCKELAGLGLPPLRQYWQEINRHDRAVEAWNRADRKRRDKKRTKCRCDAYKFPHRPTSGLCRYPDPPAQRWQDAQAAEIAARVAKFRAQWGEPNSEQSADLAAMTTKTTRPYRKRYAGIRRQIARANGLHPIRDRALIDSLLPAIIGMAKQIKDHRPRVKYRNMEITDKGGGTYGLTATWQTAGPRM